jgi:hypothetical protein
MTAKVSISCNGTALIWPSEKFSYARCSVNARVNSLSSSFSLAQIYLFISLSRLCQHHSFLPLPDLLISPPPWTTATSCHQSHTMSGCAVGPDGKLLDAKDIKWYEDADSSEAINNIPPPAPPLGPSKPNTIHPFFGGGLDSAAGSRRSGRVTRPSNRITDPDNAEVSSTARKLKAKARTSTTVTHKRKASRSVASGDGSSRRIKVGIDNEASTDDNDSSDYEPDAADHPATSDIDAADHPATSDIDAGDTEPDEDPEIAYMSTKAMGDADREVSLFSLCEYDMLVTF